MITNGFLSVFSLKILACIFMCIDHIGVVLYPQIEIFRIIGRLALPIFAYLIAEGCAYTKNKSKRFFTIFLFGLAYFFFYIFYARQVYASIFITFSFSIMLIYLLDYFKVTFGESVVQTVVVGLCVVGFLFALYGINQKILIDYGFFGSLLPVFVWIFKNKYAKLGGLCVGLLLLAFFDSNPIQYYSLLALIPLFFYNGKIGKFKFKYGFYIFYPLHLAVIQGIAMYIK